MRVRFDVRQFARLTLRAGDLDHAETCGTFAAQQKIRVRSCVTSTDVVALRKGAINAGLAEVPFAVSETVLCGRKCCEFVVYKMVLQLRRRDVSELTTRFKRRGKFVEV